MEPQIPISCISNLNDNNKPILNNIKCLNCGGVYFEPVFSIKEKNIFCKKCFYKRNNIDSIPGQDISKLYFNIENNKMNYLNQFKYYCPFCLKNNLNNNKEYTYDSLRIHLVTCQNKIVLNKICIFNYCYNIMNIHLKDVNQYENIDKIILANNILEKEIENEKLQLNYIDYKNYLNTQIKISKDNKKNSNIKNEYLNKKRKNEKNEKNENSGNKKTGIKRKNSGSKNKKSDSKSNNNNKIMENQLSRKKEIDELLFQNKEKDIIIDNNLVDICQHWKGTYKNLFSCCNKEYGCDECHFKNEQHHMVYNGECLCLFCYQKFTGEKCPFCLIEKIHKRKKNEIL